MPARAHNDTVLSISPRRAGLKMRVVTLSILAVVLGAHVAQANEMVARGIGTASCAQYAEIYRSDPKFAQLVYELWAQGFMSGWNFGVIDKRFYKDIGSKTVEEMNFYINAYCDAHPLSPYLEAVMDALLKMPLKPMSQSN